LHGIELLDHKNSLLIGFVDKVFSRLPQGDTAVVKIPGQGKIWGVILVRAESNQKFNDDDQAFLQVVANTLGTYILQNNIEKAKQPANVQSVDQALRQIKCTDSQEIFINSLVDFDTNGNRVPKLLSKEALADPMQTHHFLLDSALVGVYITLNGVITRCNQRFASFFEYQKNELIGKELDEIFRARENNGSRYCMLSIASTNNDDGVRIINTRTKKGNSIWLKCVVSSIERNDNSVVLGNVIDITEQVKVEDSLVESEKELRLMSLRLLNAQENERKRVASELHDGISQSLSSLKYKVEQSTNECGSEICEVNSLKQFVVQKIQGAIEEIRRISMDLRPSILDDLGIIDTANWLLREYQSMHAHIKLEKTIEIREDQIPEVLKISIFRILQEALNNISKHANASSVKVDLRRLGSKILLTISDDGRGIGSALSHGKAQRAKQRIGLGLKSMQERAKLTGGVFGVGTSQTGGTRLQVLWSVGKKYEQRQ
jgi:PAS domain S-box-containing protein